MKEGEVREDKGKVRFDKAWYGEVMGIKVC